MAQDLPSLNALHAFEAAARLGSVSRAALELHVTHGAVSRQIRTLEEQLGVALFIKDGRGLKLTEAGIRLRDVSGETFTRLRQVCGELRQREVDTPFVLGCPGSLLARWFIPRLDRLNSALPDLRLQLSTSQGELDPRSPQVDATLLYAEPPWPADMHVFELARESIGPVISPRHPRFSTLSEAAPEALLQEALLHTTSRPQAWPQWLAAMNLQPTDMRLGQGFEHLYYLLEAASAGLGVAIAPLQLVADDLAAGRLVAPWGFVQTEAQLSLWVPERRSGQRAERLADWLRTALQTAS
ncbi:LysR family transcriptional regulator [Pseudomonas argentinensis]|uniref:DNA-binding transcriptional regulator, LysR family n=1 Tax=Phytopseudomonas argentinensis TaxID=289370 RepID=A0A1I3MKY9_9GAMM|nr:LysR family transcriptional regulator [Pseudomonas argentinensis]KAB0546767.1 LysR family transcriptional regulator [Pseudomonas argentinensis]SFI97659.1 DNA-binding transcriptional regulator, LysR family [Pseudomonas argentinensis]